MSKIIALFENVIEMREETYCQLCIERGIQKKSEVLLHGKNLCFDCTGVELSSNQRINIGQTALDLD